MKITYSKPSADIKKESRGRFASDKATFKKQVATYRKLKGAAKRMVCILCAKKLSGEKFTHRSLPFVICKICKHIQIAVQLPKNYLSGNQFHSVYPKLSEKDYNDRKRRIYTPKLNWILKTLKALGYSDSKLKNKSWFEIGCGAGYFLSSLKDFGAKNIEGCDGDEKLVEYTNQFLGKQAGVHERRNISESIRSYPADIYAAFYVLEHVEDAHQLMLELCGLPKGTVFVFAVPVFGFAALLDNAFSGNFARNLDGVLHTQLYSDESINYAMNLADYDIKAKWVFGQDTDDLWRYLRLQLQGKYSESTEAEIDRKLTMVQDNIQAVFDQTLFSDQRHILAVKR